MSSKTVAIELTPKERRALKAYLDECLTTSPEGSDMPDRVRALERVRAKLTLASTRKSPSPNPKTLIGATGGVSTASS